MSREKVYTAKESSKSSKTLSFVPKEQEKVISLKK
jgi:hypothetical protein